MRGRNLLLANYFILIIGIITAFTYFPALLAFAGSSISIVILFILFLLVPLMSLYFAYRNVKIFGRKLDGFGLLDRIITYTPFFEIATLVLILVLIGSR